MDNIRTSQNSYNESRKPKAAMQVFLIYFVRYFIQHYRTTVTSLLLLACTPVNNRGFVSQNDTIGRRLLWVDAMIGADVS